MMSGVSRIQFEETHLLTHSLGWTSPDGREFGVVCQWDGTAFVEVKKDGSMIYLGRLNSQAGASQWRDAKVIADHAYIGAESSGSGMQIFDLKQLLDIKPSAPKTWAKEDVVLFKEFGNSHNIVANPATHTIFAAGTGKDLKCKGGLWMVDVKDPKNPKDAGCVAEDGYTHDADCVIYKGPHKQYHGREICFNYNEKQLAIFDVTERSKPKMLSRMTYKDAVYCHQGWIIDPEMKYLAFDDEADENFGWGPAKGGKTITYIVDIQDLTAPKITGYFQSSQKASDHNLYSIGGIVYQSNYGAGLRVIDMRSVVEDPTGKKFQEIGYFDVRPEDDAEGGKPGYVAAWSVYPFFKSGHILINSIERGIFSVKMRS